MNAAGISMFYGAVDVDTWIAEIRAPIGSFVVVGLLSLSETLYGWLAGRIG